VNTVDWLLLGANIISGVVLAFELACAAALLVGAWRWLVKRR
jgi:hypothetical protein